MADHLAIVEWSADGAFESGRYSRRHIWRFDGGAEIAASSSPHVVQPPFSDPSAVDPEEALVASASSCHMLWFLHVARDAGYRVRQYRDEAHGRMGRDSQGRMALLRITLRPQIIFDGQEPDPAALERLHEAAHEQCFIANSLRTEIVVES
ncbi:OsmC family protein [Sphingosinicella sp. BN140058]|uniref:OsmC family protein n=1 Tax=Sphingosinicella sp. BN140058 TaxID=1892855 RepID=UPI0010123529|nr:OsmC family protein [Sphingosinicella sp. BN140058]QAY75692.1 OsmC family peroxiredoxin [Sphingosinicella sp. BN140058]